MAVSMSQVASTHFNNLSPSPITPNFVPSPIYRAPSSNKSPRSSRNTVHWADSILQPSISKTVVPDARNKSPSANGSGNLKARKPSQEFDCDLGDRKFRGHQRRTPLDAETFVAPDKPFASYESSPTNKDYYLHGLIKAARKLDPDENVFEKHRKKDFEWVLTLPSSVNPICDQSLGSPLNSTASRTQASGARRYFGCNLLDWTKATGKENQLPGNPGDRYLLLATPLDLEVDFSNTTKIELTTHQPQFRILQQDNQSPKMATSKVNQAEGVSPRHARNAKWSTAATADASEDSDNTLTMDPRHETKAPLSTAKDSLEKLDHFEDEIDALSAATRLTHITDPEDKTQGSPSARKSSLKATSSARSSSVHEVSPQAEPGQDDEKMPGKAAPTRKVARPASLAPPKPLQKATKVPTVPTFELPGERVARELKEKKAARLSKQLDAQKLAAVNSPPERTRSVRSSKPPTVPNFELPGETISRLKKERFAAKLKAEEEEAARRRQFKARPPPSSVGTSSGNVRSTFTSRQRESQGGSSEQQNKFSPVDASPKSGAAKRQSVTMSPSMARTARTVSNASASSASTAARGRTSSVGSSHLGSTRATSSSNGSVVSSKRSSVPAEEAQQQKARNRSIYTRDNSLGQDKEREKRERQQAIALARQKYADQSRMLAANRRMKQQSSASTAGEHGA